MILLPPSLILLCLCTTALASTSPKRGLIHLPDRKNPQDDQIWLQTGPGLSWYYNYGPDPSRAYTSNSKIEFIPMLWGPPIVSGAFYSAVKGLQDSGVNVTYVLGFNEPDEPPKTGGSSMSADDAARFWIAEMEPLKKLGVLLGAPAVTGSPRGQAWYTDFLKKCDGKCTVDFLPVHWYGAFEGLASHVGAMHAGFGDMPVWVTEFGLIQGTLKDSQNLVNSTLGFLDNLSYVQRYAYFGAFRSSASNIGPSAAMLTQDGKLTDIGSWYLGGSSTGNVPKGAKSDATRKLPFQAWLVGIVLICIWNIR